MIKKGMDMSENLADVLKGEIGEIKTNDTISASDMTDTYNGQRMAMHFKDKLKYCEGFGGWVAWDGKRWQIKAKLPAKQFAKETARNIYVEAGTCINQMHGKELGRWAEKSLSNKGLDAMLACAMGEMPAMTDEFDQDHYLLNLTNGILNLKKGELTPHDPGAMITKLAGTNYDPEAQAPTWMTFLDRVMGSDADMIAFLQRAMGYSLTGSVAEQVLLFAHGPGANGKTTFIRTLLALMGDYGQQSAPKLLMKGERHDTEIARLAGIRTVATVEVEEGGHMAEVMTKQLTGGDRVTARYMHHDFFEFEPTHKIWLVSNHKPIIRGTDHAIWRRVKLIPFTVTIPEEERDPLMLEKLLNELPGILNWALAGCLEWQKVGLNVPGEVNRATESYRDDMDIMGKFLEDRCTVVTNGRITTKNLYASYKLWCEENGERDISQTTFGTRIAERGFTKGHSREGNYFEGIEIKAT